MSTQPGNTTLSPSARHAIDQSNSPAHSRHASIRDYMLQKWGGRTPGERATRLREWAMWLTGLEPRVIRTPGSAVLSVNDSASEAAAYLLWAVSKWQALYEVLPGIELQTQCGPHSDDCLAAVILGTPCSIRTYRRRPEVYRTRDLEVWHTVAANAITRTVWHRLLPARQEQFASDIGLSLPQDETLCRKEFIRLMGAWALGRHKKFQSLTASNGSRDNSRVTDALVNAIDAWYEVTVPVSSQAAGG